MKKFTIALIGLGLILGLGGVALAGNTATQTVSVQVTAINEISVSGSPAALNVSTATAGSAPNDATDATTTYSITTNGSTMKITGQITSGGAMPSNTTLKINLAAPTGGGSSAGAVTLGAASASDLVTGIPGLNESGKGITYTLSATSAAAPFGPSSKTVTLTVAQGT